MNAAGFAPHADCRLSGMSGRRWALRVRLATASIVALLACTATAAKATEPLIVGGTPAAAGTWPWMAFLIVDHADGTASLCSATVIAPNLVLSAAHCVVDHSSGEVDQPGQITVFTGSVKQAQATADTVARVIVNPGFAASYTPQGAIISTDWDLALLALATTTSAPAVTLASDPQDRALLNAGEPASIAGWGLTNASSMTLPDALQVASTVVQNPVVCAYHDLFAGVQAFDDADQLCTIGPPPYTTAICSGDSGGPLIATRPDGTPVQIGVTIYAQNDCSTTDPSYFERVDVISGWVSQWRTALALPTLTTLPATHITATTATLNAEINPHGLPANIDFQYGTSTGYGAITQPEETGNGTTARRTAATITDLTSGATYHFRLMATNAHGTTAGADATFTTTPPGPPAGIYRGRTSQAEPFTIHVAANHREIVGASFGYTLRCARHRSLTSTFTPAGSQYWPRPLTTDEGFAFADSLSAKDGTRVRLTATFTAAGTAAGTLTITRPAGALGVCRSGTARWHATRDRMSSSDTPTKLAPSPLRGSASRAARHASGEYALGSSCFKQSLPAAQGRPLAAVRWMLE